MSGQETTAQGTSAQSQAADTGITVRVESFVGPLDLLLHLCRTNEMDLSRLSLRTITDQYLAHLEAVRFQDLETAGSFMVMAATLIYLKSKLLLPANPDEPEEALDEEGELLKRELEERLREYARVKALGAWLSERESEQSLVYGRTTAELPPPEDIPLEDLSVHLLQRAMQRLIEDQKRRIPRQVEPNPLSVLERMGEITDLLRSTWSLLFSSVAGAERLRAEWVVTLLALLELVRLGQARARQAELFGEIVIERHSVSVREPNREVDFAEEAPETEAPRDATAEEESPRPAPDETASPQAAMDAPPETTPTDDEARTEEGEPRNA
jgi:segregation and condensation protein A